MHWQALQYVAGTNNTVPFDRAPVVVSKALNLIKSRASIICENDTEFNEILTVAYMEGQKTNVSCLCNLLRRWICLYVQSITLIAKRVWVPSFLLYLLELLHGCISACAVRSQETEDWGNSVYHFSMWADRWNLEIVILMSLTGWHSHHGGCRNSKWIWGEPVVVLLFLLTFLTYFSIPSNHWVSALQRRLELLTEAIMHHLHALNLLVWARVPLTVTMSLSGLYLTSTLFRTILRQNLVPLLISFHFRRSDASQKISAFLSVKNSLLICLLRFMLFPHTLYWPSVFSIVLPQRGWYP